MALLREIGVPPRLYRHAELVGEAADLLLAGLQRFRVQVDEEYVHVGAALHDAGKALHPSELTGQATTTKSMVSDYCYRTEQHRTWRGSADRTLSGTLWRRPSKSC